MAQRIGYLFMFLGVLLGVYSFIMYHMTIIEIKLGMIWNIVLFSWDCLWLLGTGISLLIWGITIHKGRGDQRKKIATGGYLLIFTTFFLIMTWVFNGLADPVINSNGRIFSYIVQSTPRLFAPSLSPDFLVPFGGLLFFGGICFWFKRKIIGELLPEESDR